MTLRSKIELAVGIILLAVCALVFRSWLSEHDARLTAEITTKAMQSEFAKLEAADAQRAADLQKQLDAQKQQFTQAVTPAQIADLATRLIGLKQPIQIVTPSPTASNPNPEPVAQIALPDAPQVKSYLEECETCKLRLPELEAQHQSDAEKLKISQGETQAWQKAARGTKWSRLKTALKWIAFGAGTGAVAMCGTGHCR